MEKHEFNSNNSLLATPQPTATSTVEKLHRKALPNGRISPIKFDDSASSLGVLSIKSSDLSLTGNKDDLNFQLEQQRALAADSIRRHSKVSGLPSKYFRPNKTNSELSLELSKDSTIDESDLLQSTPNKSSTPRNSYQASGSRMSLGESLSQLSKKYADPNVPIEYCINQLQNALNGDEDTSDMFIPADQAASKLLADEISWRKRNDVPITSEDFSKLSSVSGKISMGEYFHAKSENLSELVAAAQSPEKESRPVPLIDSTALEDTISIIEEENMETPVKNHVRQSMDNIRLKNNYERRESSARHSNNDFSTKNDSLSLSTIAKLLQSNETPGKVVDYLLNKRTASKNSSESVQTEQSLPVSKNSSYTSDYSDNEAMMHLYKNNKENNANTLNTPKAYLEETPKLQKNMSLPEKSSSKSTNSDSNSVSSSSRSSSRLTSLPDGKLPIQTNKCDIVFNCVRIGKSDTKEFILRNNSSKTIRIQMRVTGQVFKLRINRNDTDPLAVTKTVLHAFESRSIAVTFTPVNIKAEIDAIVFTSADPQLVQTKIQKINLYGYGGYGNIETEDVTKDVSGKFLFSLGCLNGQILKKTFTLRNSGNISCFACLSFISKEMCMFSNISVSNNFIILSPKESKKITITYTPSNEDFRNIQKANVASVIELGVIKMISGTEVNRGRLRRLCRKSVEAGRPVDPMNKTLIEKIHGEVIPSDVINLKESVSAIKDILSFFKNQDIILIAEQDPDQTIMPNYSDDSAMFTSLCQDTVLETTILKDTCKLEPSTLILSPPYKLEDHIFLTSESSRKLHFEIKSEPEGLEVTPQFGELLPKMTVMLHVCVSKKCLEKKFIVKVYVENEVFEANVKILNIQPSSKMIKL